MLERKKTQVGAGDVQEKIPATRPSRRASLAAAGAPLQFLTGAVSACSMLHQPALVRE